jgi:hypothetical protein
VKDSFKEKLERVFDKYPKYHMKILLGDFSAKVGKENILKLIENEISNDNGVRLVDILGRPHMGKPTIILTVFR